MQRLLLFGVTLAACGPGAPTPPAKIHTTYRAIGGISMGAVGAAGFGLKHPDRFDAFVLQGGPFDVPLFLRNFDRFLFSGFCSRAEIEAVLAQDPSKLNDPAAFASCRKPTPTIQYEVSPDFSHFIYNVNAPFDRTGYVKIFSDLALAYGNFFTQNDASPYAPPGVDPQHVLFPPADFCSNPVRVHGLRNLEYNADGKYDAITFCDGEQTLYVCNSDDTVVDFCSDPANLATPLPRAMEAAFANTFCASKGGASVSSKPELVLHHADVLDPCREGFAPMQMALAFDFNGNGRRDWGEPLVNNGEERYPDVGKDGCPDAREDGQGGCRLSEDATAVDPNHDNYDALANPMGTEGNWRHDDGEPFSDDGLDGVPGTHDFGEGNGAFDMTQGRRTFYTHDPRTLLSGLDAETLKRMNLLFDGGIRDFFNFGLTAQQVFGRLKMLKPDDAARYRAFADIPGMSDSSTGRFNPWSKAWAHAPKDPFVLYGNDSPTDSDLLAGEGDHVGTMEERVDRISMTYGWVASQWPSLPRPTKLLGGAPYKARATLTSFDSKALGAKRNFGLYLPIGYDLPENVNVRYPVLYLLHGYNGDPYEMLQSTLLADAMIADATVQLTPMIVVNPSGRCCFKNTATGARDCRETDDAGNPLLGQANQVPECAGGTFYVDEAASPSLTPVPYEDAFLELMDYVDANYRTLPPADLEQR